MDLAHLCQLKKAETASHGSPKVVVHGNDRVWLKFLVGYAALCRCSMVLCVLMGYRCVACWWGAIRGGRHGKLVDSLVFSHFIPVVNAFSRSGFARHFFLEFVGCCNCRPLVGTGFLWLFPDLLSHPSLICLLLVYAGCCRRPGQGINTGLFGLFCRAMVGCCRRPGRGSNTGLSFIGLQGSGSLRPEAPRLSEVCLFPACVPYGCHRLAHLRARSHRAVCGRSLRHSPDVR